MNTRSKNIRKYLGHVLGKYLRYEEYVHLLWVKIRELDPSMETYGLRWESEELQNLGRSLVKVMTKTLALQMAKLWIISASAVAAGVVSAFAWPAAGTSIPLSIAIVRPLLTKGS